MPRRFRCANCHRTINRFCTPWSSWSPLASKRHLPCCRVCLLRLVPSHDIIVFSKCVYSLIRPVEELVDPSSSPILSCVALSCTGGCVSSQWTQRLEQSPFTLARYVSCRPVHFANSVTSTIDTSIKLRCAARPVVCKQSGSGIALGRWTVLFSRLFSCRLSPQLFSLRARCILAALDLIYSCFVAMGPIGWSCVYCIGRSTPVGCVDVSAALDAMTLFCFTRISVWVDSLSALVLSNRGCSTGCLGGCRVDPCGIRVESGSHDRLLLLVLVVHCPSPFSSFCTILKVLGMPKLRRWGHWPSSAHSGIPTKQSTGSDLVPVIYPGGPSQCLHLSPWTRVKTYAALLLGHRSDRLRRRSVLYS
jgi:hypothetical protein